MAERPTAAETMGGLSRLLADAAVREPDRVAFRDGPDRSGWSGRPSLEFTCAVANEAVRRLAGFLSDLALPPGSAVALCLPNGTEACLSILAVEAAGLTPCLLDASLSAGELSAGIEAADARAIITQAVLGPERPAEKLCFVAAGFFRLRYVLAFGPQVPAGVLDLDRILVDPGRRAAPPVDEPAGLITFRRGPDGLRPLLRSLHSVVAATALVLEAARIRPGDHIVTLLPPDDLKGVASGLAAALLADATLETHGVFSSRDILEAVDRSAAIHLVAPGFLESALAQDGVLRRLRSAILVHDAPNAFVTGSGSDGRVVDLVSFGEIALLAGPRVQRGRFAIDLDRPANGCGPDLVEVRVTDGGTIAFRGPVAGVEGVRPGDVVMRDEDGFAASGFRAERLGSVAVGTIRQTFTTIE